MRSSLIRKDLGHCGPPLLDGVEIGGATPSMRHLVHSQRSLRRNRIVRLAAVSAHRDHLDEVPARVVEQRRLGCPEMTFGSRTSSSIFPGHDVLHRQQHVLELLHRRRELGERAPLPVPVQRAHEDLEMSDDDVGRSEDASSDGLGVRAEGEVLVEQGGASVGGGWSRTRAARARPRPSLISIRALASISRSPFSGCPPT